MCVIFSDSPILAGIGSVDQSSRIQCSEQALSCQYGNILFFWLILYGRRRWEPKDNWTDWCCSGFSAGKKCVFPGVVTIPHETVKGERRTKQWRFVRIFLCLAFWVLQHSEGRGVLLTIMTFSVLSVTEIPFLVKDSGAIITDIQRLL